MLCPCKDCEKKGCGDYHSQCKAYLEFSEFRKQANKNEREQKIYSYNTRRREKWKKKN